MNEKITQYFNRLFEEAPKTRKALDLKQEMTQNALDKYADLLQDGYTEEAAYQNIIQSIGDVTELFSELEEKNLLTLPEADRKKRAMLKAIASGLYIFAGTVFLICITLASLSGSRFMDFDILGLALACLICIAPTIMMVYAANMYPDYTKKEPTDMVEMYKEWNYLRNRNKAVRTASSCIIWTAALAIYFITSFATQYWHVTWIIFLIAACVQSIVTLLFSLQKPAV